MKKLDIECYNHNQKQLLIEDQYAVIFSFSDLLHSHSLKECLERIYQLESDRPTKLAWKSALEDLDAGVKIGTVLFKTGLFKSELNTIFLLVEDYSAIQVAEKYVKSLR